MRRTMHVVRAYRLRKRDDGHDYINPGIGGGFRTKRLLQTLGLLFWVSTCTALAENDRVGENCDLSKTGGPGKESFFAFDRELRAALSKQDPVAMSFLVDFPLHVRQAETSISINDEVTLQARFQELFPAEFRSTLLDQEPETVSCNWSGIYYGRYRQGRIWVQATDQRYALGSITLPGGSDEQLPNSTPRLDYFCNTQERRVVIDTDTSGIIRYRAWNKPRFVTDKPDVEITPGTKEIEGSGICGHPVWTFSEGDTEITVDRHGCSPDSSPPPEGSTGSLTVSVAGESKHRWCY